MTRPAAQGLSARARPVITARGLSASLSAGATCRGSTATAVVLRMPSERRYTLPSFDSVSSRTRGKAQPGAGDRGALGALAPVEAVEHAGELGRVDAKPGVLHDENRPIPAPSAATSGGAAGRATDAKATRSQVREPRPLPIV